MLDLLNKYETIVGEYIAGERSLTVDDTMQELGITRQEARMMMDTHELVIKGEHRTDHHDDELKRILVVPDRPDAGSALMVEQRIEVEKILAMIDDERCKEIIVRSYGIYDDRMTLEEMEEVFGISHQRISGLKNKTIKMLQERVMKNRKTWTADVTAG